MDRNRPTGGGLPPDRPPRDRPPRIPWTPFGPGDKVPLDAPAVVAQAEALRAQLIATRTKLERLRRGGAPPDDREPPRPFTGRRSNLLLPYLLIRTIVGDTGARPMPAEFQVVDRHQSPDIILTTPDPNDPPVVGRGDFNTKLRGRIVGVLDQGRRYDVWVHVWNLGHAPAYGVRVRAWCGGGPGVPPRSRYIGGRQLDLGDRNSPTSHLVVKLGSWQPEDGPGVVATAECIADTCNGTHDWSQDRHTGQRDTWAIRLAPPPVTTAPP
jgi:hypothetical protein